MSRPSRQRHAAASVPFTESDGRRTRGRRGGPRTPLPLLPVIAVCAGIAIAYVSQTAHATQATYETTSLAADQQTLRQQAQQLGDDLDRLESAERIVAAAQAMGMRPAARWAYVASAPVAVVGPSDSGGVQLAGDSQDPSGQLVGDVSGDGGGR